VALGVNFEGKKEVLGLWIGESEGAKFWASVLNERACHIFCLNKPPEIQSLVPLSFFHGAGFRNSL
jgi:hypothetical protein